MSWLPMGVAARRATAVAGTFLERDDGRLHNTAVVLGPDGSTLGSYRKIHLFAHRSREAELVTPGDTVTAVDTPAVASASPPASTCDSPTTSPPSEPDHSPIDYETTRHPAA